MRITLVTLIVLLGLHIGLVGFENVKEAQDKRMDALCKANPSMCRK
jgi:hypothetical protein